jgi:phosphoglycolate phosphatase-like HAD superfamily hydrolase
MERMADVSGRTEPVIFRETLALHGIEYTANLYRQFADEQARGYTDRITDLRQRGRALPGAADALATLARRDDALQSVLTGNTRPASHTKLGAFGLDAHLNLDAAAFGTDSDERADLVDIARHRAAQLTGLAFGPTSIVLIGDTPADVAAAQDGDARIIAVASGGFSADAVALLWETVRDRHEFGAFVQRASPQLLRWESRYGWTTLGWGQVSEKETSLASVLARMLAAPDAWTTFTDCYLAALDQAPVPTRPPRHGSTARAVAATTVSPAGAGQEPGRMARAPASRSFR